MKTISTGEGWMVECN